MTADQLGSATFAPTLEDVSFYREHGYWISPVILPDHVLDEAERGIERFYASDVDHSLALDETPPDYISDGGFSYWGWRPRDGNVLRKNFYTTLRVHELAQLAHYPAIASCAAGLSRSPSLRLWHDQLLYKPNDTIGAEANVRWHTDRYYWMTCSSEDMLTAWIPFADVTEEDGAMSVVDGSRHWTDDVAVEWQDASFSVIDEVLVARPSRLVPIELKRGQVSFHHCKTLHGSGPNRGATPRRSLVVHFQPATNGFVQRGRHHANDGLVSTTGAGLPDYTDADICPVLYP
jgi:hypothetical protein